MRIAWAKLSMSMEIDYNINMNGFGEERPMLFKSMLDRGHSLKLLTPLNRIDTKTLDGIKSGKQYEEVVSNSWMRGLEYEPMGFSDGADVLVIENGPLNMMYIDPFNKIPQIRRMMEIINKHEGLVLFYQSDPLLPFPLWRLSKSEYGWNHNENKIRLTGKGEEQYGWGDFDELFKNKKIVVIGKSVRNDETFPLSMDGPRFRYDYFYKEGLVKFDFMQTGYDEYFIPHLKKNFSIEEKIYPLSYMGFPRSRIQDFKRFYKKFGNFVNLFGPWETDKIRKKVLEETESYGMQYHGYLCGYINLTSAHNKTKCEVNLLPRKANELGWISNRLFESIFSGCITLGDSQTYGIEKYLPEELIINEQNYIDVINSILNMTTEQYWDLWNKQYLKVVGLNYNNVVAYFESLVQKWK